MSLWIWIAIAAAAFQTLRFMLQKQLSMGALSAGGATFARFAYSAPLVALGAASYVLWQGAGLPEIGTWFWSYALIGGLCQILATWCVVALFAMRNFAVGITFKKTEVVLTVLVGFLILGDRVSLAGLGAILIGLLGVLILSERVEGAGSWMRRLINPAAGLGLASGVFFALSAVMYRGATLEVQSVDPLARALIALAFVTAAQTVGLGLWLAWKEPGQVARVWSVRAKAIWMGLTSLGGSLCWFLAFTLQNAAYVFAVGQIEVIFSIAVAVLVFHERITARELWGIGLLTASILGLVLLG